MKKTIKNIFTILMIGIVTSSTMSCGNSNPPQNNVTITQQPVQSAQNVSVQPAENLPSGFNVNEFANLLKTSTNADALTTALNTQPNSINNLDLDGDGNVDYLRVNQVDNNTLQVVDETSATQKTVVATLNINTANNSYSINGSPDYCGNNYIYNSSPGISLSQYMFLTWWMSPYHYHHPYYCGWGYHTHYYGGYHPYHSSRPYTTRTVTEYKTIRSKPSTNTANRVAPAPVRNISAPVKSQKSFSAGEGNRFKQNNSGNAFKPAASKPSSNGSRSFGGSSSRSFGGGRRR